MIHSRLAKQIIENLTTSVLCFDKKLHLHTMNPSAETLLEVSTKQVHGLSVDSLFGQNELLIDSMLQAVDKHCPVVERGMRLHLSSGKTITVDCSVTPILTSSKSKDIQLNKVLVELVQIDQYLRVAREEHLFTQQQATHHLIRGLAHEIKNPLGGLRGAAQLLERELPNEQLQEYTKIIIGEADRLQNLLNRMLGPKTMLQKQWVNIHHVLIHVQQLILSEVSEGIHIECDYDPSIPEIYADFDQLIQAILNIMRNAVQAMDKKGTIHICTRIHRQLTLANKRYKLVVRIDIKDNGPGIPEHMLEQIFYPLVTGRAEGTGLGLSIAQSLINRHGGLIECASQPGETIFTTWLPIHP